jgi:hypothetical protein
MEACALNKVYGLLGDLVSSITNCNHPPVCNPNIFATIVFDQVLEVLGDLGFITRTVHDKKFKLLKYKV